MSRDNMEQSLLLIVQGALHNIIFGDGRRPQQTYNPRLSPSTNMMVKRLVNADRIYFEPGKSEYLWARWRDPATGIYNDGVISHLHA